MSESFAAVDSREVEKLFAELEELSGKKAGALLRERAGLLGRVMAERTVPFEPIGDYNAQKQSGEKAVVSSMKRTYIGPASTFKQIEAREDTKLARAFYRLLKKGKHGEARDLVASLGIASARLDWGHWDGGARHRQKRRNGTIPKSERPMMLMSGAKEMVRYSRQQLKRVGYAKRGWIAAARMIPGAKGFARLPAWMKSAGAPGVGTDRTRQTDPFVALENRVPYIGKLFRTGRQEQAQRSFQDLLMKDLRGQISHLKSKHRA